MRFKKTFLATALCGLALFAMSSVARANTITLTLDSVTPNAVGPFARFTYSALLSGNSQLDTGDYFVIYDFNGFAGFDSAPGSSVFVFPGTTGLWAATISPVGPYPTGTGTVAGIGTIHTPATDSGLLNLVFTYTGATVISPPLTSLVTVSALAGNSTQTPGEYGSQDQASATGLLQGSIQGVNVPGPGGPPNFLPTPAAACGGFVLMGLLASKRSRKNG